MKPITEIAEHLGLSPDDLIPYGRHKAKLPLSLLDRARREALLRLKEAARASGYHGVVNVRLETSQLARARSDGKGTAGIEVLAFGTGVRRAR